MATFRVTKTSNYSVMSNYHLDDNRLSLKAIGLLSFMLRLPNDWRFNTEWLAKQHKDGVDSVRSGVKELEDLGYITRRQLHNADGTLGPMEYEVFEVPPGTDQPPSRDFPVTVEPSRDFPVTEKPSTENPRLPNTIEPSTEELSTIPPIVPPQGDRRESRRRSKEPKSQPDHRPEKFAAFWKAYPKHKSKDDAIRAWDKLAPNDELLVTMARALKRQLQSEDWRRGIGIPYASTWLNGRRWLDEEDHLPAMSQNTAGPDDRYTGEVPELWT